MTSRIRLLQELSKSGIVTLVLISVLGGYLAGHPFEQPFEPARLALTLLGILLLASGSSAMNQVQERKVDATMPRTAGRPLPSGRISLAGALTFVLVGIAAGLAVLAWLDWTLFVLGCAAVLSYNVLYTMWWKRRMPFAAVPGAIPGALPILMGYVAARRELLAPGGLYLFFILFFWQMPHFWVLALRYSADYKKGGFPTLPVAHGEGITVSQIAVWCLAYVGVALAAPLFLGVGSVYLTVALILSGLLLWELWRFARNPMGKSWLRFFLWVTFSLVGYVGAAVADLWSVYLIPYLTR